MAIGDAIRLTADIGMGGATWGHGCINVHSLFLTKIVE
jgi:hypothetical protein